MQLLKLALYVLWFVFVESQVLPSFNWDPRNYLFEKKENCNDDYYQVNVALGNYLTIVCPSQMLTNTLLPKQMNRDQLYENMYVVTKNEFDDCKLDKLKKTEKLMLSCDNPMDPSKLTYKLFYIFYLGVGKTISFKKGETYYFIATSNGSKESLENTQDGHCKSNNMRLAVHVCIDKDNCETKQCRNPIIQKTTPSATQPHPTTRAQKETTAVNPNVVKSGKTVPKVQKQVNPGSSPTDDGPNTQLLVVISLFSGILAGILIGVVVVILAQKYFKKKDPAADGHEVFTVEAHEDANETLRREANRKYFSTENPEYRHSTEFKRLLSTSSGASSERYSATPVPPL